MVEYVGAAQKKPLKTSAHQFQALVMFAEKANMVLGDWICWHIYQRDSSDTEQGCMLVPL
jgi:hypothetical protein